VDKWNYAFFFAILRITTQKTFPRQVAKMTMPQDWCNAFFLCGTAALGGVCHPERIFTAFPKPGSFTLQFD
jgi:hypothetical protein